MNLALSRRQALFTGVSVGFGFCLICPRLLHAAEPAPSEIKDEDIFNFALNLEYMEAEYYLRGTRGKGLDASDVGSNPGKVTGGDQVTFKNKAIKEFLEEVAENELAHVRFYRKTLGSGAVERPTIDFVSGLMQPPKAQGLAQNSTPSKMK
jgi:hypothetical protein